MLLELMGTVFGPRKSVCCSWKLQKQVPKTVPGHWFGPAVWPTKGLHFCLDAFFLPKWSIWSHLKFQQNVIIIYWGTRYPVPRAFDLGYPSQICFKKWSFEGPDTTFPEHLIWGTLRKCVSKNEHLKDQIQPSPSIWCWVFFANVFQKMNLGGWRL